MNSDQIFDYSEDFLEEIIDDLIKLKIKKIANPKSNEFDNRLKSLMGKTLKDEQFIELISLKDNDFKKRISLIIVDRKEQKYWVKTSQKKLKKEFYYNL
jgi:preprotein translocase subunit SecA